MRQERGERMHEANWYADPHDATRLRYWDGTKWTDHVADAALTPAPVSPAVATGAPSPATALPVAPIPALNSSVAPIPSMAGASLAPPGVPVARSAFARAAAGESAAMLRPTAWGSTASADAPAPTTAAAQAGARVDSSSGSGTASVGSLVLGVLVAAALGLGWFLLLQWGIENDWVIGGVLGTVLPTLGVLAIGAAVTSFRRWTGWAPSMLTATLGAVALCVGTALAVDGTSVSAASYALPVAIGPVFGSIGAFDAKGRGVSRWSILGIEAVNLVLVAVVAGVIALGVGIADTDAAVQPVDADVELACDHLDSWTNARYQGADPAVTAGAWQAFHDQVMGSVDDTEMVADMPGIASAVWALGTVPQGDAVAQAAATERVDRQVATFAERHC
jgi:hypothetical protein